MTIECDSEAERSSFMASNFLSFGRLRSRNSRAICQRVIGATALLRDAHERKHRSLRGCRISVTVRTRAIAIGVGYSQAIV
jgi:hypothetical protein